MNTELQEKIKKLPKVPGVYVYINEKGKIIYIGKAKNIKSRVSSYFQGNLQLGTKTYALVQNIFDMYYIEALSELEAIILESSLIKKHKPKYNVALKDDKSYLYIVIRKEEVTLNGTSIKLPKIIVARETDLLKSDTTFGPYPHGDIAKYMARVIRGSFPYRDCSVSKFNKYNKLGSPCLYGHLGLCSAPCTGAISVTDYKESIKTIKKLLSGESVSFINNLEKEMKAASENQNYEEAAEIRNLLNKFHYLRKSFRSADKYIDNPYLVDDLRAMALDELVNAIPVLGSPPQRIECYDIATLSGKEAVGSMVVAIDGVINKSHDRKFKIKTKDTPDDFGMLAEVLTRRFKREKSTSKNIKKWGIPDLVIIDGGKGQVSAINEVFKNLEVNIPLIGIAKRFETIVYYYDGEFVEVKLDKGNEGLKLIQRLRDEAHRFARVYHHQLRIQKLTS